jgi:prepilin-type N-terminal cleavage/methylation domain-containing protein
MRNTRTTTRRGFTLVELLVVLTIIGILMALLIPAVAVVRRSVINGRISLETAALAQALEAYKNDNGDYPPNFNDANIVRRHIAKRWQRLPAAQQQQFVNLVGTLDPAETLVFWLGGQSPNGGLRANDVMPLQLANGTGEAKVYFPFKQDTFTDNDGDGWYEYPVGYGMGTPFVYFDARSYVAYHQSGYAVSINSVAHGTAKPYTDPSSGQAATSQAGFINPQTYQIITAGQDGFFGTGGHPYPTGPYPPQERDNITNFSDGSTLQDKVP